MKPQAKKKGGSVKKMAMGGFGGLRGMGVPAGARPISGLLNGPMPSGTPEQMANRAVPLPTMGGMNRPRMDGGGMGGDLRAGMRTMAKGGAVKDSKMPKKLAGFFAKKGEKKLAAHERREAAGKEKDTPAIAKQEERALKNAPADMKNYEAKEHKAMEYKKGGKVRPKKDGKGKKQFSAMMARAMAPPAPAVSNPVGAPTTADMGAMMSSAPAAAPPMGGSPGMAMGMKKGGGVESKGKTQGKMVKMASGGKCYARGGGIESKGKTRGRMC